MLILFIAVSSNRATIITSKELSPILRSSKTNKKEIKETTLLSLGLGGPAFFLPTSLVFLSFLALIFL